MKQPSPQALEHSQLLRQHITEHIENANGKISFAQFMQHALYTPGLGYYSSGTTKFGAAGDFITAPELGNLFANCLAMQCAQILQTNAANTILELGAGSGQLACDLLLALAKLDINLENYFILELSADLRQRQQHAILQQCPQFSKQIQWLDQLPSPAINGVIIANEVMDAMPITRFCVSNKQLQEYYVTIKADNFVDALGPASKNLQLAFTHANIARYLQNVSAAYSSEINLWLPAWLQSLSLSLNRGAILLIDYGFARSEYYHPQRNTGTLMCHYQHHSHSDPFLYPGLQDISAHVDFSAVANAAIASNLELHGYTNLASFLINCGITTQIQHPVTALRAQELNTLTSPAEMGELFKVMALTKDTAASLTGFRQFDKRYGLDL